jgi:hypothetical protein
MSGFVMSPPVVLHMPGFVICDVVVIVQDTVPLPGVAGFPTQLVSVA